MHELSIAQSILEIVQQNLPQEDLHSVKSVKVQVGELCGVVPDSLEFCFSAIAAETSLYQARLEIERIPFTVYCPTCRRTAASALGVALCPQCGSAETNVLSGTELRVLEIELEDSKEEAV